MTEEQSKAITLRTKWNQLLKRKRISEAKLKYKKEKIYVSVWLEKLNEKILRKPRPECYKW